MGRHAILIGRLIVIIMFLCLFIVVGYVRLGFPLSVVLYNTGSHPEILNRNIGPGGE